MNGRCLAVLRHARAAQAGGLAEEDRPLTSGGERDAAAAGRWLSEQGLLPDLVLCSPARRARDTWEQAAPALARPGRTTAVDINPRLYYGTSADVLLGAVRETPADVWVLLLVGHNPAVHQLVSDLTGQPGSFPPAALAVISLPAEWADVVPGAASLTRFWAPDA
jgi:phosphohistidine phosphatase